MMPLLWCAIYVGVILLVGFSITSAILRGQRRSIVEIIALTLVLGPGIAGTLLFWISLAGIRQSRAVILSLGVLSIILLVFYGAARFSRLRLQTRLNKNLPILFPIILLFAANLIALILAMGFDTFEWDAWVMWGFKAKVFHEASLSPRPAFFNDVTFSFAHPDYPPLLSMLIAGAYGMMGQINEPLGKVVLPMLYAGQTLFAYLAARRWLGKFSALLLTTVLICAPFSIEHAGIGNADTVLTTFYLASINYLIRWTESRDRTDIVLSAMFCVFLANTKSEGLPIALLNALVLLVMSIRRRRDWMHLGLFTLIFACGAGVWWIWRMGIPHTHDDYASRTTWPIFTSNIGRFGLICREMAQTFIEFSQVGVLWLLLPFMAIVGYRAFAKAQARILWSLIVLQLALYVFVYIITDWDVAELLSVTRGRLLLHIAPAAMLLTAIHWADLQCKEIV